MTGNREFWAVTIASSTRSLAFGASWPFMAVYFNTVLGFPLYYVGILFTLLAVVSMFFNLFGGAISDRIGRKSTILAGSMIGTLIYATLALLISSGAGSLLISIFFVLSAVSGSLVFPSSSAMIADVTSTNDRSRAYAIYRVMTNLGWAIGPITGSYILILGLQWIFAFLSIASIVQFSVVALFVHESYRRQAEEPGNGVIVNTGRRRFPFSLKLVMFSLATFFVILVSSQFSVTLPVYANKYAGVLEWQLAYIYAVNGTVVVLGQIPMNLITRKMKDTNVMIAGMFFYSLGYTLIGFSSNLLQIMLIMVIITTGENLTSPGINTVVSNIAPRGKTGLYMGFTSMMNSTARALGPSVGTAILFFESSNLPMAWAMISSFGIIAIVMMLIFKAGYERPASPAGVQAS